jgi:cytochrome c oxidase subunit III
MSAILLLLAVLGGVIGWWLAQQRLTAKPWLEVGAAGDFPGGGAVAVPPAKLGLWVFIAVLSALFALTISAYLLRRDLSTDWRTLPAPPVLWVNTALLIMSAIALQWAQVSVRAGDLATTRAALLLGAVAALAFLAGQLMAWQQLSAEGFFLADNPAITFFYLLTGLHGVHVIGGLVALGGTTAKAWRVSDGARVRQSVELCTLYWHFLLVVWLVLFALLMRWVDDVVAWCRPLLGS